MVMSFGIPVYIFFSFKILDLFLLAIKKPTRSNPPDPVFADELSSEYAERALDENGQDDESRVGEESVSKIHTTYLSGWVKKMKDSTNKLWFGHSDNMFL